MNHMFEICIVAQLRNNSVVDCLSFIVENSRDWNEMICFYLLKKSDALFDLDQ